MSTDKKEETAGYNPTQKNRHGDSSLEDEFKQKIVTKFKNHLSLQQLEELEKVATEKFPNYNPHI